MPSGVQKGEAVNQMMGFLGWKAIHNSCGTPRKRERFEILERNCMPFCKLCMI